MLLTKSNRLDIDKYYRGTFVKFSDYSEQCGFNPDKLFLIQKVAGEKIIGVDGENTPLEVELSDEEPVELSYPLPRKSFFQCHDVAALLVRVPARQFRRGICSDNTNIHGLKASGTFTRIPVNFESLLAYVNKQKFYSLSSAGESDNNSVVLTPRMAFVPKSRTIYVDDRAVGVLANKTIKLLSPVFKSEIVQMLTSTDEFSKYKLEAI